MALNERLRLSGDAGSVVVDLKSTGFLFRKFKTLQPSAL
jgi:hypothetical protein